jgi:hypothetical protein
MAASFISGIVLVSLFGRRPDSNLLLLRFRALPHVAIPPTAQSYLLKKSGRGFCWNDPRLASLRYVEFYRGRK